VAISDAKRALTQLAMYLSVCQRLLPSIVRTAECGFRYLIVLGYDKGDAFYDDVETIREIKDAFEVLGYWWYSIADSLQASCNRRPSTVDVIRLR